MAESDVPAGVPKSGGGGGGIVIAVVVMVLLTGGLIVWRVVSTMEPTAEEPKPVVTKPKEEEEEGGRRRSSLPPPPPKVEPSASASASAAADGKPKSGGGGGGAAFCGECSGDLSPAARAVLKATGASARRCYERALQTHQGIAGKIVISVKVSATGSVCAAGVASDSVGGGVAACVLPLFRSATLPPPTGGCAEASVPLSFEAKQ